MQLISCAVLSRSSHLFLAPVGPALVVASIGLHAAAVLMIVVARLVGFASHDFAHGNVLYKVPCGLQDDSKCAAVVNVVDVVTADCPASTMIVYTAVCISCYWGCGVYIVIVFRVLGHDSLFDGWLEPFNCKE